PVGQPQGGRALRAWFRFPLPPPLPRGGRPAASPGVSTRSEVIARRRRGQGARPVVSTWELSRAGRRARVAESCDETGGVHRGRAMCSGRGEPSGNPFLAPGRADTSFPSVSPSCPMTYRFFVVDDDRHYARLLSYRIEKDKEHETRVFYS